MGNEMQVDGKILRTFQKSFLQVQGILDQNKLLTNEINQSHESSRNVVLIRELNNNIRRVVNLSSLFTQPMEASSDKDEIRGKHL